MVLPRIAPKDLGILAEQKYLYGAILVFFILYFATGSALFGLLIGLTIVWLVVLETWVGVQSHGVKNELKELAIALLLAAGAWFGAGFILNTPSPLNAIVSCSMLPHLQRGDMAVLSGDRIMAQEVGVQTLSGVGNAEIFKDGQTVGTVSGSLYSYCAQHQIEPLCAEFVSNPSSYTERQGPLAFGYAKCEIATDKGDRMAGPCVEWLEVNGTRYYENLSNDVVVYQPLPTDYYARTGDIIHRAFLKIKSSDDGKTYVLTKGDNNPIFDLQVYDARFSQGNRPVDSVRVKGRILATAPIIGYLKLFISPGAIATPEGCDRHYTKYDAK
jgi:signal peptidase I